MNLSIQRHLFLLCLIPEAKLIRMLHTVCYRLFQVTRRHIFWDTADIKDCNERIQMSELITYLEGQFFFFYSEEVIKHNVFTIGGQGNLGVRLCDWLAVCRENPRLLFSLPAKNVLIHKDNCNHGVWLELCWWVNLVGRWYLGIKVELWVTTPSSFVLKGLSSSENVNKVLQSC